MNDLTTLQGRLSELKVKRDAMGAEMRALGEKENPTDGDVTRAERLLAGFKRTEAEIQVVEGEYREAMVEGLRNGSLKTESGSFRAEESTAPRRDAWQGLGENVARGDSAEGLEKRAHRAIAQTEDLSDEGREALERMVETDANLDAYAFTIAASDPYYRDAFNKAVASEHGYRSWSERELEAYRRVEAVRASMSLTSGNGGLLAPVAIDPTLNYTNSGTINPIRGLARTELTTAKTWTGAATAGSTGTWTAENTAFTAGDPTFTAITISPSKLTDWVTMSVELEADAPALVQQLPELIREAFDRAEATAFVNGTGSGQPTGIITAISATAGSTVTATTRGTFTSASVADLYAVDNALPSRSRNGRPAWIANRRTLNVVRQMSATANGSSFWANLSESTPPLLLDSPIYNTSDVLSTTTTGTVLMVLGDWQQYLIVDRVGVVIERVDTVVDGSGVPTGTRGWTAWKRVGSHVANVDAFRFLLM